MNLDASFPQTGKIGGFFSVSGRVDELLETGELDSGDVLLAGSDAEGGGSGGLSEDHVANHVISGGVLGLGEGEGGGAHDVAHGLFRRNDLFEDRAELDGESVALLLEEGVASRGADQASFHHAQHRHRRNHVQALPLPGHLGKTGDLAAPAWLSLSLSHTENQAWGVWVFPSPLGREEGRL